jgi:Cu+-exporting ATPase
VGTVVFDKTGTLTRGRPELTDVVPAAGTTRERVLEAAATAERHSEHPLAGALLEAARRAGVAGGEPDQLDAHPGRGVVATFQGRAIAIGTPALLAEHGAALGALEGERARLEREGKTVVAVADAGRPLGLLAFADQIKPGAPDALEALRRAGLEAWMITGDNVRTAKVVARAAGIAEDRVLSEVSPAGKRDAIASLQRTGRRVAMVGDGINDAPALAQAKLGIAMGGGTDVAMEAADVTLVRSDLMGVPVAIRLARATLRVIRQNLFWAFVYNVVGIPIAAGALVPLLRAGGPFGPLLGWSGELHPMIASLAMALSSVSVVSSSLRLRRFR